VDRGVAPVDPEENPGATRSERLPFSLSSQVLRERNAPVSPVPTPKKYEVRCGSPNLAARLFEKGGGSAAYLLTSGV